jgi:hypothetical protein
MELGTRVKLIILSALWAIFGWAIVASLLMPVMALDPPLRGYFIIGTCFIVWAVLYLLMARSELARQKKIDEEHQQRRRV